MHISDAMSNAVQSILSHKLRSFLTLTGIVIGVLAVVTMFSSVYALKALVRSNMEGMGWNNSVIVMPAEPEKQVPTAQAPYPHLPKQVPVLNYADFEALRSTLHAKTIYGMVEDQSRIKMGTKDVQITLRGTNTSFFITKSYVLQSGRYFNNYEENTAAPVVVLGYFFAQEQFGNVNPVGRYLNMKGKRFLIIGVLAQDKLNMGNGMNFNSWERNADLKALYIPLKYATTYLSPRHMVHYIYAQAADEASFPTLKRDVRQILLARHQMYPNFQFQNVGDLLIQISNELNENMKKWNITLFAIASISLIVGGIGLFSTLLISIQEKMLEIGVRKSLGATEGDIFLYFIFEAVCLALMGALLGIAFSALTLFGMQAALHFTMHVPYEGMLLGIAFSILIGFVSGLYPALKAGKLDPIKAIYYFD